MNKGFGLIHTERVQGLFSWFLLSIAVTGVSLMATAEERQVKLVDFADPFVLAYDGAYYAYGTHSKSGIEVAVSKDLVNWQLGLGRAKGNHALYKDDSYGERTFWAPEVYRRADGKFVMHYTADCKVCAAVADHPLGPFRQVEKVPILGDSEPYCLDNSVFFDKDGKPQMIYSTGAAFKVVKLDDDLVHVLPGKAINIKLPARAQWEKSNPKCQVREGPFVIVLGGKYVLSYSANDYQDHNYAVGYVTADQLDGEWKPAKNNPILLRRNGLVGCGHHSFFKDLAGEWKIAYHAHYSATQIHPRQMYFAPVKVEINNGDVKLSLEGERQVQRFPDLSSVSVSDDFWSPKFALWRTNTIEDVLNKFDQKSRAIENFDLAAKGAKSGYHGIDFFDGLIYETIRGASDYLAQNKSPELEKKLDALIDRIVASQMKDGYLHTSVQIHAPDHRWGDNGGCSLLQHEIYNAGCLIEAGIHYYKATGKLKLLAAAIRFANLMVDTMGPRPKRNLIPTHSMAEGALMELAQLLKAEPELTEKCAGIGVRVRAPQAYLALVKFWFDAHGDNCGQPDWPNLLDTEELGGCGKVIAEIRKLTKEKHDASWRVSLWDYQMDAKPLREYQSIEGHAVRAALLLGGLAAYARETGDKESLELALRFWHSMTGKKLYISGGVGAIAKLERFAADYQLPPDAYLETCAAVASAFSSTVLAEITGEGKYFDEFERVAYNALLTAVGENGNTYTYQNPLNTENGSRWDWHHCPCCPPMFLKLTGALPKYIYGIDAEGLRVNLFVGSEAKLKAKEVGVAITQTTQYPEKGEVNLKLSPERPVRFALKLRIPGWARGVENYAGLYLPAKGEGIAKRVRDDWEVQINGEKKAVKIVDGYVSIEREWKAGDSLRLNFDVSQRRVVADERVKELVGMHALMRGPVLMAEEKGALIPYYQVANRGTAPHKVWFSDK